jgi:hypothetical protein
MAAWVTELVAIFAGVIAPSATVDAVPDNCAYTALVAFATVPVQFDEVPDNVAYPALAAFVADPDC